LAIPLPQRLTFGLKPPLLGRQQLESGILETGQYVRERTCSAKSLHDERLYVPRVAYTTGDVDAQELTWQKTGSLRDSP
jgi:hypothetical protein